MGVAADELKEVEIALSVAVKRCFGNEVVELIVNVWTTALDPST
jgi:hypothetical protein